MLRVHHTAFLTILLFLSGCSSGGGGGGAQDGTAASVLGRWVGTVELAADQACTLSADTGVDLAKRAFVLDVTQEVSTGRIVVQDEQSFLYAADQPQPNNSFEASSQYFFYAPMGDTVPIGPTSIALTVDSVSSARVTMTVFYDRFCTTVFTGAFVRQSDAPEDVPQYREVRGVWRGELTATEDTCELGVDPLREVHTISFDGLDVALIATDQRLLETQWISTSNFTAEFVSQNDSFPVVDAVTYDVEADSSTARVVVTRTDGNRECVSSWEGTMHKDPA
ncbi:MAG: hypothetical protein KDD69_08645 [Bdellovibrionales bacterium]|nr:hypothetical protein [Bdellovibrionales bacterium]